jgi:hypothetical protein
MLSWNMLNPKRLRRVRGVSDLFAIDRSGRPFRRDEKPERRSLLVRSGLTAAVLLAAAGLGITLLSAPTSRYVHIGLDVEDWTLPQSIRLSVDGASNIKLRGSEIVLDRIASITGRNDQTAARAAPHLLISGRKDGAPSSVLLAQRDRKGIISVQLPQGTRISAYATTNPAVLSISYSPPAAQKVSIKLEAEGIEIIEANRVILEPDIVPPSADNANTYNLTALNHTAMVLLDGTATDELVIDFQASLVAQSSPTGKRLTPR